MNANDQYLHDYDKTKPSNYLMYWDANNLYVYGGALYAPASTVSEF